MSCLLFPLLILIYAQLDPSSITKQVDLLSAFEFRRPSHQTVARDFDILSLPDVVVKVWHGVHVITELPDGDGNLHA